MGLCEVGTLSDNGLGVPMVAKFFSIGTNKEKRYKRFKNEIIALNQLIPCQDLVQANAMRNFHFNLPEAQLSVCSFHNRSNSFGDI